MDTMTIDNVRNTNFPLYATALHTEETGIQQWVHSTAEKAIAAYEALLVDFEATNDYMSIALSGLMPDEPVFELLAESTDAA